MNRFVLAAAMMIVSSGSAYAQTSEIFDGTVSTQLEGQDIDVNIRLLEALTRAAKKGPKFRVSPDKVFMSLEAGSVGAQTIRVSNVGDEGGEINGINAIGAVKGLSVSDNCPAILSPGGFCDVAIRFESTGAEAVQTVVVASFKERDSTSFDIPLQIEVKVPAPKVDQEEERRRLEEANRPIVITLPPEEPKGPTSRQIAGKYFAGIGGQYGTHPNRGIVTVTRPDELKSKSISGFGYNEVGTELKRTSERYDKSIAYADASLPVNRDKILTSDRVIKAVLDTPVSNVMCGKVVAVVESDVYSATGQVPLIPAGSRAIGSCGEFAEERVGIAWSRIITTDGRSISLDTGLTGTSDASGLGGGLGRVYKSNFDRFVLPILSTFVDATAGVILASFGEDESVVTTGDGSVVQETSSTNEGLRIITSEARGSAQELIAEIRDVREVMVLPAGSRIDIELSQDIYFKNGIEVVRLGDTTYEVGEADILTIPQDEGSDFVLVPYTSGLSGPVVVVGGRRFIVSEKLSEEAGGDDVSNPVVSDLKSGVPTE